MSSPRRASVTSAQRSSAPKVLLASRTEIDKLDTDLTGIAGAREVIALFESRRNVKKLLLGHNDLGDDGVRELFHYLCSEKGRQFGLAEISLNSNGIGDRGLESIAEYIAGSGHLRELSLQNNNFEGDSKVVEAFVNAVNKTYLEVLTLVGNDSLSDRFLNLFLPELDSPHLRELHLSSIGLTSASTPAIIAYLTSPRSRPLETFKCNANRLGLRAVRSIVRALRKGNATLLHVEMYANFLQDSSSEGESGEPAAVVPIATEIYRRRKSLWEENERELKKILIRNELLKKKVERAATQLLPFARAVLLCPARHSDRSKLSTTTPPSPAGSSPLPIQEHAVDISIQQPPSPHSLASRFHGLPPELQYHILEFLAPVLSNAQFLRVLAYASSPFTLPPLLPRLAPGCMPDPSAPPAFMFRRPSGCGGGSCMGAGNSVMCHRIQERKAWLHTVGCSRFELEEGLDVDALLSLKV